MADRDDTRGTLRLVGASGPTPADRDVLRRLREGDLSAVLDLEREHGPALLDLMRLRVGDEPGARLLAQRTLILAQAALRDGHEPSSSLRPWLLDLGRRLIRAEQGAGMRAAA